MTLKSTSTLKAASWKEFYLAQNEGNQNLTAYSQAMCHKKSKTEKLLSLVEELNSVILLAGDDRKIIVAHSPWNFGGTRARPMDKVVVLHGMGERAICLVLDKESVLKEYRFRYPTHIELQDAFYHDRCESELDSASDYLFEQSEDYKGVGVFIPGPFLRDAILKSETVDPSKLVPLAMKEAVELDKDHGNDSSISNKAIEHVIHFVFWLFGVNNGKIPSISYNKKYLEDEEINKFCHERHCRQILINSGNQIEPKSTCQNNNKTDVGKETKKKRKRNYGRDNTMRDAVIKWDSISDKKTTTMHTFCKEVGIPYNTFAKHARNDNKSLRRIAKPLGRQSLVPEDIATRLCNKYSSVPFDMRTIVEDMLKYSDITLDIKQIQNYVNRTFRRRCSDYKMSSTGGTGMVAMVASSPSISGQGTELKFPVSEFECMKETLNERVLHVADGEITKENSGGERETSATSLSTLSSEGKKFHEIETSATILCKMALSPEKGIKGDDYERKQTTILSVGNDNFGEKAQRANLTKVGGVEGDNVAGIMTDRASTNISSSANVRLPQKVISANLSTDSVDQVNNVPDRATPSILLSRGEIIEKEVRDRAVADKSSPEMECLPDRLLLTNDGNITHEIHENKLSSTLLSVGNVRLDERAPSADLSTTIVKQVNNVPHRVRSGDGIIEEDVSNRAITGGNTKAEIHDKEMSSSMSLSNLYSKEGIIGKYTKALLEDPTIPLPDKERINCNEKEEECRELVMNDKNSIRLSDCDPDFMKKMEEMGLKECKNVVDEDCLFRCLASVLNCEQMNDHQQFRKAVSDNMMERISFYRKNYNYHKHRIHGIGKVSFFV